MYTASEQQLLLAVRHCPNNGVGLTREEIEKFGINYFCSFKLDWNDAFDNLIAEGDLINLNGRISLRNGLNTDSIAKRKPRYRYWYNDWYRLADKSKKHSELCAYAYGIDLCQTGMMTKNQIDHLAGLLKAGGRGIDAGCGVGKITGYLCRKTQADLTGVDTILSGICLAKRRAAVNPGLQFRLEDMRAFIKNTESRYDFILSMDTIYFLGDDLSSFIRDCLKKLAPGGKIHIFYSAWEGKDKAIGFDDNRLGIFLIDNKLEFEYTDFTEEDISHWKKKKLFLEQNKQAFIDEGNEFLHGKRHFEADLFENISAQNKMKRYFYTVSQKNRTANSS